MCALHLSPGNHGKFSRTDKDVFHMWASTVSALQEGRREKSPTVSSNISVISSPRPGSAISRTGPHPGITITHDFTTSVNGTIQHTAEMLLLLCTYHPSPFFIWNFQHHHCAMAMRGKVSMSIHGLTKRYTVNTDENRIVACIRVMMLGLFLVQLAIVAVCVSNLFAAAAAPCCWQRKGDSAGVGYVSAM